MRQVKFLIALAVVLMLIATGCERKVTEVIDKQVAADSAQYIGTDACQACHADLHASFIETGHPFKLNDASEAFTPGYYPFTTLPTVTADIDLSQAAMVIGGFRWKARFIDSAGYIMTGANDSAQVQYNFATDAWVPYHGGEQRPYGNCGPCHMTDYQADGGFQNDLPGLNGTWAFNGIQCEECHGPGELHAGSPYNIDMTIDRSNDACGKCHIRGPVEKIPASGGFIKHHEQWNELFTTKHQSIKCVDCHEVHTSLHPLNPTKDAAIKINCENCHFEEANTFAASSINHAGSAVGPDCVDCHMPRAAKSAVAMGTYEGDIRSHLVRINTAADAEMFTEDGAFANGYLTLEYTCLTCHSSENKAWAADYAGQVHANPIAETSDCLTCHNDASFGLVVKAIQDEHEYSVHNAGENTNRNRNSAAYYQSCEKCHTSEGFIAEVTGVPTSGDHFSAIDCFTCHAPHTDGTFGLRVEDAVTLGNGAIFDLGHGNLCASCHQSRRDVNTYVVDSVSLSTYWSPHYSNQADMLIGENAYEYSGYTYTSSAHANVAGDGCIDCHMSAPVHSSVGGHSWNMHNEDRGFENTSGCNIATCHDGAIDGLTRIADADFDYNGSIEDIETEIEGLLDSLKIELIVAGLADTSDTGELHPASGVVVPDADSAGALYNYLFVADDRSFGVHNTKYTVGLLQSSLSYITTGTPSPAIWREKLLSSH